MNNPVWAFIIVAMVVILVAHSLYSEVEQEPPRYYNEQPYESPPQFESFENFR